MEVSTLLYSTSHPLLSHFHHHHASFRTFAHTCHLYRCPPLISSRHSTILKHPRIKAGCLAHVKFHLTHTAPSLSLSSLSPCSSNSLTVESSSQIEQLEQENHDMRVKLDNTTRTMVRNEGCLACSLHSVFSLWCFCGGLRKGAATCNLPHDASLIHGVHAGCNCRSGGREQSTEGSA